MFTCIATVKKNIQSDFVACFAWSLVRVFKDLQGPKEIRWVDVACSYLLCCWYYPIKVIKLLISLQKATVTTGAWLRQSPITGVDYLVIDYLPTLILNCRPWTTGRERHRCGWSSRTSGTSRSKGDSPLIYIVFAVCQVLPDSGTELSVFRGTQDFPVYLVPPGFRGSQVTQDHLAWGEKLDNLDPQAQQENGLVLMPVRQLPTFFM